ncbi:MAG: hypothetical protein II473_00870 [Clostridia bacterium]|jgi:hypothetical protein|nr:hypothetical protein [Clostridia bacterium]MBQ1781099.1 hypothetical protein [Bacteroidales bacterium]MBQ1895825.1 hypothetical protein [Clostridia bacterium]MBQ2091722.1 hypothetical protein [Clostridia bacterium]MCR4748160.1 hypothetical protein [Clostridiales bacterium]
MKQLMSHTPLDIIPHPEGFIIAIPDGRDERGKIKVAFRFFNFTTHKVQKVKKNFYAQYKFGRGYVEIVQQVKDYLTCTVCEGPEGFINVVYPTGEIGVFDYNGTLIWTGDLSYHDCPVRSCAPEDNSIWCCVPDQNAVVRYSKKLQRIDFRIGGASTTDIGRPMAVSRIGNELFVCCKNARAIKKVSLKNYVTTDYKKFEEPVLRYMRVAGQEVVVLSSGIYILD